MESIGVFIATISTAAQSPTFPTHAPPPSRPRTVWVQGSEWRELVPEFGLNAALITGPSSDP